MTTKEQYLTAYRIVRSQWNWNLAFGRKSYEAYQMAKRIFGDDIATAAVNTLAIKEQRFS